jgi:hypothetical protein
MSIIAHREDIRRLETILQLCCIDWSYVVFCISISAFKRIPFEKHVIICYMSPQDWAGFILTILSIIGIVGVGVRWIIKTYVEQIMNELKPNGGGSIKDQVTRLEDRVNEADLLRRNMDEKLDKVYYLLIDHIAEMNKKKSKSKI